MKLQQLKLAQPIVSFWMKKKEAHQLYFTKPLISFVFPKTNTTKKVFTVGTSSILSTPSPLDHDKSWQDHSFGNLNLLGVEQKHGDGIDIAFGGYDDLMNETHARTNWEKEHSNDAIDMMPRDDKDVELGLGDDNSRNDTNDNARDQTSNSCDVLPRNAVFLENDLSSLRAQLQGFIHMPIANLRQELDALIKAEEDFRKLDF